MAQETIAVRMLAINALVAIRVRLLCEELRRLIFFPTSTAPFTATPAHLMKDPEFSQLNAIANLWIVPNRSWGIADLSKTIR